MIEVSKASMKKGMKDNIDRKQPTINDVLLYEGLPLFSFVELNINEICNRQCVFCPRVNPDVYPNQNIHMDIKVAENIANQLAELNFNGIVNISGTGEPLLTKYITDIVNEFGKRDIHVEIVTNGDVLKRRKGKELIKNLYAAGLKQFVVSMYDGPEQIKEFKTLFDSCGIQEVAYSLRDRWYDESEDYGLLYTNRAGNIGFENLSDVAKEKLMKSGKSACFYTHYAMMIDWNGDALLCCQDMYNRTVKFGNVKNKLLIDIWRDAKLTEFRNKLKNGERSLSPCSSCNANGQVFGGNHAKLWNNHL
jgi:radical SAM protein with 4Fe4S-binding SPASM domain